MTLILDETHDPARRSWVASANGHADFPIQNLPLGVFAPAGGEARPGVAIGDQILDLARVADRLHGEARDAASLAGALGPRASGAPGPHASGAHGPHASGAPGPHASGVTLNALLAAGADARQALRHGVAALLDEAAPPLPEALHDAADCTLLLPAAIGDYTDFYAGIHHATAVGRLFRPDQPLMPNYKYVPIAYHGRASSVVPSGTPVRRPRGQIKRAEDATPLFGPSGRLDFELELGLWIGPGNARGEPIAVGEAAGHIAGYCLLNDWSARDIQAWEYQPLGPFLAKSFLTSISPWIVTPEALAPFRIAQPARAAGDPAPLDHLLDADDQASGALALALEVWLAPSGGAPERIAASDARHLYWTPAQMVAHHASNGCDLRPGDLFGSGTISAPEPAGAGSLLELTSGGRETLTLGGGVGRRFLEDGDAVILRAVARRDGFAPIGFGACEGVIVPA